MAHISAGMRSIVVDESLVMIKLNQAGMYSEFLSSRRVPVAPCLHLFEKLVCSSFSAVLSSFNTSQGRSERCRCV